MSASVSSKADKKQSEAEETKHEDDLDTNVIVQIKGLKKQSQHNGKYGIIVQHKLNTTSNRYRVRLLEDNESNKPTQTTMIFESFGINNNNNNNNQSQQFPPDPFKHIYVKDNNLYSQCKIDRSQIHKEGIMAVKSYKCGDIIYNDIALLQCPGFWLLWKTDSSNQITRLWQIYNKINKTKRAYFDEILYFDTNCMVYMDVNRAINKLSMEPTFKIRYLCQDEISDKVKNKLNQHLRSGYKINEDKETAFDFEKWCKILTIFRLNAINDTVYYISSKLNHSCSPNVYITNNGNVMAIRDISKGDELFVSYFKRSASLYKYQQLRSIEIQRTKGFQCKCIRCNVIKPNNLCYDDSRNFKCQSCTEHGLISWNKSSSRLFTKCNNKECGKFPTTMNQAKFMSIEKKLSVFLLENTGDIDVNALKMKAKITVNNDDNDDDGKDDKKKGDDDDDAKYKLSEELKELLNEGEKYLNKHYLLIALYHRLCQLNLHINWLRLRYQSMCNIYNDPNDTLLRATMEYHRFIPLLTVGDMMTGKIKKNNQNDKPIKVDKHQNEMDKLQIHIDFMKNALAPNYQ